MESQQDPKVVAATWCVVLTIIIAGVAGILMSSFIVAAIVFFIGLYIAYKVLINDNQSIVEAERSKAQVKMAVPRNTTRHAEIDTRIAGASHYCKDNDIGGFLGYVETEPDNPYDKNAIAIYRNDGKKLGHIPREDITKVKRAMSGENLPCIGFILDGDVVDYWGRVTIVKGDKKFTERTIIENAIYMVERDGLDMLPPDFRTDGDQPTTKKEWLEVLNDRLEELK